MPSNRHVQFDHSNQPGRRDQPRERSPQRRAQH